MEIIKNHNSFLNETYYHTVLESGLNVYIYPKHNFKKKYIHISVNFGGIHNEFRLEDGTIVKMPSGVAHFLEHQVFEKEGKPSFKSFEEEGSNVNAYTSPYSTVYYADGVYNFDKIIYMLMDIVQNLEINKNSVEKEKGIIKQEIQMYLDEPSWIINQNLMKAMLKEHPIITDIAGSVESVESITYDDVKLCYESFYTPKNMGVYLYGDLDVEATFRLVDKFQTDEFKARSQKPILDEINEPMEVNERRIDAKWEITKNRFEIGCKGTDILGDNFYHYQAALKISIDLAFGKSSYLYKNAFERKLVNTPFDFEARIDENLIYVLIANETDYVDETIELILESINYYLENGFDEKKLEQKRRKIIGRVISAFNSLQSISGNFSYLKSRDKDLFDQTEAFVKVKPEFILEAFRHHFSKMNYSISTLLKENE